MILYYKIKNVQMENNTRKTIPFKGIYWWSDSQNVTRILEKELKEIISETQIRTIEISGNDFNDGRENRHIKITVDILTNKIEVEKKYR